MGKRKQPDRSMEQQIKRPLFTVLPVMGLMIVVLMGMMLAINRQYTGVLQSANIAADFNKEFKSMLDSGCITM